MSSPQKRRLLPEADAEEAAKEVPDAEASPAEEAAPKAQADQAAEEGPAEEAAGEKEAEARSRSRSCKTISNLPTENRTSKIKPDLQHPEPYFPKSKPSL